MTENGKALRVFHTVLIFCAILYCFGFSLYQLSRSAERSVTLGVVFAIAGVFLCFYFRSLLRYGLSGKPPKGDG